MKVRAKAIEATATQITGDMTMGDAEKLGLQWDEYGERCGWRGLFTTDGVTNMPVPLGYWVVTYENGDTRIFPTAGFHEIFEVIDGEVDNLSE